MSPDTNRVDPGMNDIEANAHPNTAERPTTVEVLPENSTSQDASPTLPIPPESPSQKPSLRASDVHHDFVAMNTTRDEGMSSWSTSSDKQLGSQLGSPGSRESVFPIRSVVSVVSNSHDVLLVLQFGRKKHIFNLCYLYLSLVL